MKFLKYFLAIILIISLLVIASPLFVIAGGIATFYFWKKQPDKNKMYIAIVVTILSLISSVTLLPAILKNDSDTPSNQNILSNVQTAPQNSSSLPSSSATQESSTESSTEITTDIKNDGPEYTNESNAQFSEYFNTQINDFFAENGINVDLQVVPIDSFVISVYVPQDFKYEPSNQIQKIADYIYQTKNNLFREWAIENGYDLGFTNAPTLTIMTPDNTTLAEESIFSKKMKVKN